MEGSTACKTRTMSVLLISDISNLLCLLGETLRRKTRIVHQRARHLQLEHRTALCCPAPHRPAPHCPAPHRPVLPCTALHRTALHRTALHRPAPPCTNTPNRPRHLQAAQRTATHGRMSHLHTKHSNTWTAALPNRHVLAFLTFLLFSMSCPFPKSLSSPINAPPKLILALFKWPIGFLFLGILTDKVRPMVTDTPLTNVLYTCLA